MFLTLLDYEKQKLFLNIVNHLVIADGVFSEQEEQLIKSFCMEMNIDYHIETDNRSIEHVIDECVAVCTQKEKKIILFEILALALVDSVYDTNEKKFIQEITCKFDIDISFVDKCESIIREYEDFQTRMINLVCS